MAQKQDVFGLIGRQMQGAPAARGYATPSIAKLIQRIDRVVDTRRSAAR